MATKTKRERWKILLGETEWRKYTYQRTAGGEITMVGSIQKGILVGALVKDKQGNYYQLVGDHMVALNNRIIAKVIAGAKRPRERPGFTSSVYKARPITHDPRENNEQDNPLNRDNQPRVVVKRRKVWNTK
jgi:hypothetical protein